MKKLYLIIIGLATVFVACNRTGRFQVNGKISNAEGQTLYLEHIGLLRTTLLDSLVLNAEGAFRFKSASPEYPDFYRLRVGTKNINFAVDSVETITFTADAAAPSDIYEVSGSPASEQIRQLRTSLIAIQRKINTLRNNSSDKDAQIAEIQQDIETHKEMARRIIIENPRSMAAYFAIYQKIDDNYLFSPYNKDDKRYCAAVATSFDTYMHNYARAKNLYALVMDAINAERQRNADEKWREILENSAVGYIDIDLKDRNGQSRKLSDLAGKVILLDFSAFESERSVQYVFELRELYNKYHAKGFEIYSVSLDKNKLLWQQQTENLPWICVRDEAGVQTPYATSYNIQSIPVMFLIDKKGEIISREYDFKNLNSLIAKSL
ncbi:MAG: redoxin domain-containing protein [Paludibacter sp.]|jgi:peroxiredoxin|nr:redoxin domain-containing protein [Paludibacter sp.]